MNPEMTVNRLKLSVGNPEVEVVGGLGIAVVKVDDPAVVDVLLFDDVMKRFFRRH